MSATAAQADQTLATRVARRDPEAVLAFRTEFEHALDDGFETMRASLAEVQPPGCCKPFDLLLPHVAGASGEGFLKQTQTGRPSPAGDGPRNRLTLREHVPSLTVHDLFHAAACLQHDQSACLRLVTLVDHEVGPPLVKRFRRRLSAGRAQEIVDDVLSQTWSVTNSHLGSPPFDRTDDPESIPATRLRLEKYLGLSALKTWLYAMAYNMLLDEVRGTKGRNEVSLTMDNTPVQPADRESAPDDQAAVHELVARFRPRLRADLHRALAALKQQDRTRMTQVAYLWLPLRTQQVCIAGLFAVSKSSISQHVKAIREYFISETDAVCRELSRESGVPLPRLQAALVENLPDFFAPLLFDRLVEEFQQLQTDRPPLLQVAYLLWNKRHSRQELAEQLGESSARIAWLIEQLETWRAALCDRLAAEFSPESTVPVDLLRRRVDEAIMEWFCGLPPRGVSPTAFDDSPDADDSHN